MKENGHGPKVLIGKKAIKDYLGLNSDESFQKWIEKGMPALCEDKRWYAHKENLDNFFRAITNIQIKEFPAESTD